MKRTLIALLAILGCLVLAATLSCGEKHHKTAAEGGFLPDDDGGGNRPPDEYGDDGADDAGDDDSAWTPWINPTAKADAFRLFYKERIDRTLLAFNRFRLVNDVVPAHSLGATTISKHGDHYEVVLHAVDNNDIGWETFSAYQAYKVFRTRALALTVIRQFEGLAVAEEVSGIPGLTCREWEPGFQVTIDGPTGAITRARRGTPIEPAVAYPEALEQEIVDTFFADGVFSYDADPASYYFRTEPIFNPGDWAVTGVMVHWPYYVYASNCCSSFMVSQLGTYAGYWWGNHNSRDNFPDFASGYFAAMEAMDDPDADADVRASAARAWASAMRIGDSVVRYGYNLMTVGEFQPYDADHLIVAGELRPDGTDEGLEWLGSMNSCQMSYMAKALSSQGLNSPDEEVQAPGSYEALAVKWLFVQLGLTPPPLTKTCKTLDDAYFGLTWDDFLNKKILGKTIFEHVEGLLQIDPDPIVSLIQNLAGSMDQPALSAFALVYYAELQAAKDGNTELLEKARETLYHILEVERRAAVILMDWAGQQNPPRQDLIDDAQRLIATAARLAHEGGVGNGNYDPYGFTQTEGYQRAFESVLTRGDSTPLALWTDDQIWARIQSELENSADRPIVVDRYWARFPTQADMPMRREGDHYRIVGLDGNWEEIPNIDHQWFGSKLWNDLPMCTMAPTVLDCAWAVMGCARPDLDQNRTVDDADLALFDAAWATYGEGASCDAGNAWCGGADLDRSGVLDFADREFLDAAKGCWY